MAVYACMKFFCTEDGVSTLLETAVLIDNLFFYRSDKRENIYSARELKIQYQSHEFVHNKMLNFNI
jgi:hypothetical protein